METNFPMIDLISSCREDMDDFKETVDEALELWKEHDLAPLTV